MGSENLLSLFHNCLSPKCLVALCWFRTLSTLQFTSKVNSPQGSKHTDWRGSAILYAGRCALAIIKPLWGTWGSACAKVAERGAMTESPVEGFLEEPSGNGKFGNVIRTRIKTTCAGRKAKFDRLLTIQRDMQCYLWARALALWGSVAKASCYPLAHRSHPSAARS